MRLGKNKPKITVLPVFKVCARLRVCSNFQKLKNISIWRLHINIYSHLIFTLMAY